jgi:hypothetical protein
VKFAVTSFSIEWFREAIMVARNTVFNFRRQQQATSEKRHSELLNMKYIYA